MPPVIRRLLIAVAALVAMGTASAHAGTLWWTNIVSANHSIGRAGIDGSSPDRSFITGVGDPYGLFASADRLYWANYDAGTIARANLDGSDRDDAFIRGARQPADVFTNGDFIYWANSGSNSIGRARVDGTGVNQSFITGTRSAATVWADESHVFWGNGSFAGSSSIGRASIDGTGVDQDWLVGAGIRSPATIVSNDAFLYWTNSAGAPTVGRARLDGTGVDATFVTAGPSGSLPNGLALSGQYLYWSLFSSNAIGRAALDGSPVDATFIASPSSRAQGPGSVALSQYALAVDPRGPGRVTSAPRGIDCGTECEGEYPEATTVRLSAMPGDAARFTGWGGACAGLGACTVLMVAPVAVTAAFSTVPPDSPVLTVSVSGPGTVTSSPAGIACGSDCRQAFPVGTAVTLTPTPADRAAFTGWQGACTGTGPCTVSLAAARSVSATFTATPAGSPLLSLAFGGSGHGRVTSSPAGIACGFDCAQAFTAGTAVALTAAPSPGSVFSRWSGACSGTAPACGVAMTSARSVTATFVPDNRFRIRRVRATSRAVQESVRVPGAGRITVVARRTARGMRGTACSVRRSARRATTLRVSCTLTRTTRALRAGARVPVSVKTTFTPTGGSARAVTMKRVLPRTR